MACNDGPGPIIPYFEGFFLLALWVIPAAGIGGCGAVAKSICDSIRRRDHPFPLSAELAAGCHPMSIRHCRDVHRFETAVTIRTCWERHVIPFTIRRYLLPLLKAKADVNHGQVKSFRLAERNPLDNPD